MSSFVKTNSGLTLALAAMAAVSVAAVAQTSGSPFAKKTKKQAWETDAVRPGPQTPVYTAPSYDAPKYIPPPNYSAPLDTPNPIETTAYTAPSLPTASAPSANYTAPSSYSAPVSAPSYNTPAASYSVPTAVSPEAQIYSGQTQIAPSTPARSNFGTYRPLNSASVSAPSGVAEPDLLPGFRPRATGQAGAYFPGREDKNGFSVPARAPRGQQMPHQQRLTGQMAQAPSAYNSPYASSSSQRPQTGPNYGGAQGPNTQAYGRPSYGPQSWKNRLGLGNLLTTFSAALRIGAAAVSRKNIGDDGWNVDFIADGKISGEVSAITQAGLEYGVGGEIRGQYDKYRRGFGGQVGDCGAITAANVQGCNSLIIDGLTRPLRGHTSQFYSAGFPNDKAAEFALEGAYVFLRSAYGDVTVGRDDGAAYLFSLGAPTLMAVNASNSPVDYTGLDSVRTVNEASGFSEKIAYVSPRLLGDQIGFGVQIGASYAPNARACGVDYCVQSNGKDASSALSPDLKNVVELGLSLDRTFNNGLSIEGTATYAMASEDSGLVGFDDLKSFGLGLEAEYGPWTLGGSFLNSNNGLLNGDYEAYDIGLTFKPAQWGVSASYGHATDKNVNLLSDQATLGFIYDFERFTLGTGVQYIERDVVGAVDGIAAPRKEKAAAIFVEGGIKF